MTLWNVISASVKLPEEAQWKPANRTSVWVAVPSIDTCRRPTPNPAGYPPGRPVPEATVDWSSPTAWKLLKTQEEDKERMRGLTCAPLKRGRHVPQGDTLTGWHWHQSLYGPPSHHAHHHDREDGDGVPRHVHDEQIHGDLFERAQGDIPASLARQEEEQSTIHRQKKKQKTYSLFIQTHLLHQVLVCFLDAGVGNRLLWIANGINDISLAGLAVATTPGARQRLCHLN